MPQLKAVYPISDENTTGLPVKHLRAAAVFYEAVLGFTVLRLDDTTADVQRDDVQLGLIQSEDHQPAEAGSLAFKVDDLEAMHRELEMTGAKPGVFGTDQWGGKKHRTFFVREVTNGYCYCFYCDAR